MRNVCVMMAVAALAATIAAGPLHAAKVVKTWNFEDGLSGWETMDQQGNVSLAAGTGEVAEGSLALHLSFKRVATKAEMQQRGMPGSIVAQVQLPPEPTPTCLEFAVRVKLLTPLVVSLSEDDGSRYQQVVTVMPGKWHRAKMYFSQFQLADDSSDENGRLDGSQINALAFIDASLFSVILGEEMKAAPIRIATMAGGENEIWLDAIRLTDEPAPSENVVEDASSALPRFLTLLGPKAQLSREDAGLDGKPCWVLRYDMAAREVGGMMWGLPPGALTGTAGLRLVMQADRPLAYVLQVKEADGSEYNVLLQLEAGKKLDQQFPWPDFTLGDDSTDENGRLDVDQIAAVMLADATGLLEGAAHQAEVRLGLIEPVR